MIKKIINRAACKLADLTSQKSELNLPGIMEKEVNPINRRFEGGQLKNYPRDFLIRKDALLKPLVKQVWDAGKLEDSFLQRRELSEMDERVVEYPVALMDLMQITSSHENTHILDVGCVLNNPCVKDYISKLAQLIWFMNPSVEPFQYNNNMAYIVSDIRKHRLPEGLTFDLVTCLSTLEHAGMDNTRYGGEPAEFEGHFEHPEKFAVDAAQKLLPLVKPEGQLLISVPFGPFEYVYVYGKPEDPIYYTFDKQRLLTLKESLTGFESQILIYKIIPRKGWFRTSIDDDDILKHADNCAAAGAVAFIKAAPKR
jgi:SAM-dependent methyltransferase